MKKIGIVGATGYVGQAFTKMVENRYQVIPYSRSLKTKKEEINKCDLAVICVPTPMNPKEYLKVDGIKIYRNDFSIVEETVSWLKTPVILIKSTIEPGTTDYLKKKYKKRIVFSPEYVGEGKYYVTPRMDFQKDMRKCPFIICGGDRKDCEYIFDLLVPVLGPEKTFLQVKPIEAEITKYMENFYFGWKMTFANLFYDAAKKANAGWYDVRGGWGLDPRVDIMHTAVFPESRGFGGKCLPKDLNAFTYWMIKKGLNAKPFIEALKYNLKLRGKKDYLESDKTRRP